MIKQLFTTASLLFLCLNCLGQLGLTADIQWSDEYEKTSKIKIGTLKEDDVYREGQSLFLIKEGTTDFLNHDKIELPTTFEGQEIHTTSVFILKEDIIAISSFIKKKEEKVYYHLNKIDQTGSITERIELAVTDYIKPVYGLSKKKLAAYQEKMKTSNAGSFLIVHSPAFESFAVLYKKKKQESESKQTTIVRYFNDELKNIDSEIDFPEGNFIPSKYNLTKDGKLFGIGYLYERQGSTRVMEYSAIAMKEALFADRIGQDYRTMMNGILVPTDFFLTFKDLKKDQKAKTMVFDYDDKIKEYKAKFYNDLYVVYGSRVREKAVIGGFLFGLNVNSFEVEFENKFDFNNSSIAEYTEAVRNDNEYNDLRFRELLIHDNNSFTLLAERFQSDGFGNAYKNKSSVMVTPVNMTPTPVEYSYLDIIAVHMDNDGKKLSEQTIKKGQIANEQFVRFASFYSFSKNNLAYILYNDLKGNAVELEESSKKLFKADPATESVVTLVKFDPKSDASKAIFIDFEKKDRGVCLPTLSTKFENSSFTIFTMVPRQNANRMKKATIKLQ